MKLQFNVDAWLPKISQCVAVVSSKNSLPILSDLLIEKKEGGGCVTITASDSETWLSVKADVVSSDAPMRFCINAVDFHKALLNLKGKEIEMDVNQQANVVTCKHANGHFKLPCEDAGDFPQAIELNDETMVKIITGSHMLFALEKAGFATANDELRPVMNGVHFDFTDSGMVAVASDGHKLAKFKNKEITTDCTEGIKGFTLPKKPANLLMNILSNYDGQIKLKFNERAVVVNNDWFKLTTRLIEGKYPNYESVIPKENEKCAIINKADFISALKRVLPMSNTTSELVSVNVTADKITLSAVDNDFSKSASEHIACVYNNDEITIGFKGSTLLAIVQNIDGDSVQMLLKDPSRAALFTPNNGAETTEYVSLLMPMIIND